MTEWQHCKNNEHSCNDLRAAVRSFHLSFFFLKRPTDISDFLKNVAELKKLEPSFVTLTYGAGGSQPGKTEETAGKIQKEIGVETACHLACIAHTRQEIAEILNRIAAKGIENIVALRGDAPKDRIVPPPHERDFGYARDLVEFIKKRGGFWMAVAGYPETHPEAKSAADDMAHLVEKVSAGAHWVITQLFFDNAAYFDFVRKARGAGITLPIVPGIMPVTNYAQLQRFTSLCGTKLPQKLTQDLSDIQEDVEAVINYGIEYATNQCAELLSGGAPGIHFYTLNRSRSTSEILRRLEKRINRKYERENPN